MFVAALLPLLAVALVGADYYAVRFKTPITNALRADLEQLLGYEVRDYLGSQTLLLWLDNSTVRADLQTTVAAVQSMQPWARILQLTSAAYSPTDVVAAAVNASRRSFAAVRSDNGEYVDAERSAPATLSLRVRGRDIDEADLRTRIASAVSSTVDVRRTRQNRLLITGIGTSDIESVAQVALELGKAKVAEVRMPFVPLNRWAAPRIWRAGGGDQANSSSGAPPLGLTGANQLLSISDTGVASATCFFTDPARQVPRTAAQAVPADTGHRKIRAYWSAEGDFDDTAPYGGHGSHVVGSALGSPVSGSSEARAFSGTAPGARLVFTDLHTPESGGDYLYVPDPLDSTVLQWSYDCGARIHSVSWGAPLSGRYTSDEAAVDRFVYLNREFLPIFAAGNSGPGAGTIVSPAMAKNALTIGATMNGVDAVRLAQTPARPDDDYSPDWLASFSSRGSSALSFRKPDLVAPGGAYVWSAANTAPSSGTCAPLSQTVLGLQGTSMATPHASSGAVLLRQYFVDGLHQNNNSVRSTTRPMASLLRATLAASATPLRGVFPRAAFASTQARIDGQGHGRIALDRALGAAAALTVLANEDVALGVSRTQTSRRWCVDVRGAGAYESIAVAMAYADYPSFPVSSGAARLVNDLRLRVYDGTSGTELAINELTAGTPELRSTIERAVAQGRRRLIVDVHAAQLGFGDEQTFSLVLALIKVGANEQVELVVSSPTTAQTECRVCTASGAFAPASECAGVSTSTVPTTTTTTTLAPSTTTSTLTSTTTTSTLARTTTTSTTLAPTTTKTQTTTTPSTRAPTTTSTRAPTTSARTTPKPTPSATPKSTPRATPKPTPKPTPRTLPSLIPRPTPKPTPRPTPPSVPVPTPKATVTSEAVRSGANLLQASAMIVAALVLVAQ